jgi:hypothetical protein
MIRARDAWITSRAAICATGDREFAVRASDRLLDHFARDPDLERDLQVVPARRGDPCHLQLAIAQDRTRPSRGGMASPSLERGVADTKPDNALAIAIPSAPNA